MLLAILFTALVPLTPTFSVSALSAFSTLALFKLLLLLLGLEKSITSWGWRRRGPCIHGAAAYSLGTSDKLCHMGSFFGVAMGTAAAATPTAEEVDTRAGLAEAAVEMLLELAHVVEVVGVRTSERVAMAVKLPEEVKGVVALGLGEGGMRMGVGSQSQEEGCGGGRRGERGREGRGREREKNKKRGYSVA